MVLTFQLLVSACALKTVTWNQTNSLKTSPNKMTEQWMCQAMCQVKVSKRKGMAHQKTGRSASRTKALNMKTTLTPTKHLVTSLPHINALYYSTSGSLCTSVKEVSSLFANI